MLFNRSRLCILMQWVSWLFYPMIKEVLYYVIITYVSQVHVNLICIYVFYTTFQRI